MSFSFLSPLAVLLALACAVPLAALLHTRGKGRRTRSAIGLPEPPSRWYLVPVAALVLAAAFVGLAAAQPVIVFEETTRMRTDAEVMVVLDTTRSMLARQKPTASTRIGRARAAALALRKEIPSVPVGLASITDRTLAHLFPSIDEDAFRATLSRSIGVERPPPIGGFLSRATRLDAIATVATQGYYSPNVRNRALVVLTDGESLPNTRSRLDLLFGQPPGIRTIFVQIWGSDERVFVGPLPEPGYRPDPTAHDTLERFSAEVGGTVFTESQLAAARSALRDIVGSGPTVVRGERREHVALAPFLAGAAFLPLVLLLWRRDR